MFINTTTLMFGMQQYSIINLLVIVYIYLVGLTTDKAFAAVYIEPPWKDKHPSRKRYKKKSKHYKFFSMSFSLTESYWKTVVDWSYAKAVQILYNGTRRTRARRDPNVYLRSSAHKYRRMYLSRVKLRQVVKSVHRRNLISMMSERTSTRDFPNKQLLFDTDSFEIKVDSGCSLSMTGTRKDFVDGSLTKAPPNITVGAYGGAKVPVTHIGTIKWTVLDDSGTSREILLPGSLLVPSNITRLLSPQHLAQVTNKPGTSHKTHTIVLED